MEEKVAMCTSNEESKGQNPLSSEKQGNKKVKIRARIVIANVENDEAFPVENDVEFEIPPVEVRFQTKLAYKFRIRIGFTKTVRHPTTCLVDTGTGQNFLNEDCLNAQ